MKKNLLSIAHKLNQHELNWIGYLIDRRSYIEDGATAPDVAFVDAYKLSNLIAQVLENSSYPSRYTASPNSLNREQRIVLCDLLEKLKEHCDGKEEELARSCS